MRGRRGRRRHFLRLTAALALMVATDKCLAQNNKSRTGRAATKKCGKSTLGASAEGILLMHKVLLVGVTVLREEIIARYQRLHDQACDALMKLETEVRKEARET